MSPLLPILASVGLISLIAFIGVFFLAINKSLLNKLLGVLVSFASGALLGGAFLHLLPEATEQLGERAFVLTLAAFVLFFVLEKFLYWRHCHEGECPEHVFTYLNLIGDGVHNFIDGAVIAAAFLTNFSLGISTTLAIALHEIPQEIGDFSILVWGGWKKSKALLFNFLSALTALAGALIVFFFTQQTAAMIPLLLPLAAGGFIYVAATDLIPQLHQKRKTGDSISQFIFLATGLALMMTLTRI